MRREVEDAATTSWQKSSPVAAYLMLETERVKPGRPASFDGSYYLTITNRGSYITRPLQRAFFEKHDSHRVELHWDAKRRWFVLYGCTSPDSMVVSNGRSLKRTRVVSEALKRWGIPNGRYTAQLTEVVLDDGRWGWAVACRIPQGEPPADG
jgi:hypothetical protein